MLSFFAGRTMSVAIAGTTKYKSEERPPSKIHIHLTTGGFTHRQPCSSSSMVGCRKLCSRAAYNEQSHNILIWRVQGMEALLEFHCVLCCRSSPRTQPFFRIPLRHFPQHNTIHRPAPPNWACGKTRDKTQFDVRRQLRPVAAHHCISARVNANPNPTTKYSFPSDVCVFFHLLVPGGDGSLNEPHLAQCRMSAQTKS